MNDSEQGLVREYTVALADYLAHREEAALRRSYEIGRKALADGLGPLEIAAAHQTAVENALAVGSFTEQQVLAPALSCLAESLSAFEMVIRGVRESNSRLQQSLDSLMFIEDQLRHQNEELTAAHRAEEKQKARYHALFEFAPDGYLVTGMEGAIREANAAAAALLRTPHDLLPGQLLSEFVREADRSLFRDRMRALQRGSIERIEHWQVDLEPSNGPHVPAVLTVAAERGTAATASLRWLLRDDTERKRVETEQARLLVGHARAEAERRFEFLAEASALLVGSLDVDASLAEIARLTASFLGGWCFVNVVDAGGALRQVAAAHAQPSSADLASALRHHCLFGDPLRHDRSALLAGPQIVEPVRNEWYDNVADSPEHAVLLRRLRCAAAMVYPLHLHGRLLGILTILSSPEAGALRPADSVLCEDLARRCALALENARLYRDVVAERDKAERASSIKDEFVAILGHELRSPLTPLAGWTRILENHPVICRDPLLSEGVKAMGRNAAALSRLISDCLDLTSVSAGKIHLEHNLLDLNQIILDSAEVVRSSVSSNGLRFATELAPIFVPVEGDALRLQQVVTNLLINATKYTDRGGTISIRSSCHADQVEIAVSDTGVGIQPELLERIFEPYRQGTEAWLTSPSGLGLGLAIARQIVQMHNGEIWAESLGRGQGTTFRVRLPKATVVENSGVAQSAAPPAHLRASGVRILLVEDSPDILFLLKVELENSGYEVITARDGQEGVKAAREHHPDLIISDIKMLLMDGYTMIRTIRAIAELSGTPAIALTGLGAKPDVERALSAGFNACVSKPGEPGELHAVIQELIPSARTNSIAAL